MIAAMKNMMVAIAVVSAGASAAGMAGATTVTFNNLGQDGAYDLQSGYDLVTLPPSQRVGFSFVAQASGDITDIELALAPRTPETRLVDVRLTLSEGNLGLGTGGRFLGASTQPVFHRGTTANSYPLTSFSGFSASVTKGTTYTLRADVDKTGEQRCKEPRDPYTPAM